MNDAVTRRPPLLRHLALLLVSACHSTGASPPGTDPRAALLQSWGEHLILPLYADFESRTESLEASVESLCAAPSEEGLARARDAWAAARAPWKRAEILVFGPYADEPLRLGPKIDFWPARAETIEAVLADTGPLDLEALGASARGLPVIEYLLYEPSSGVVAALLGASRRCTYLRAAAADLTLRAAEMRRAWDPAEGDYLGELLDAGSEESAYPSLREAVGEVANRMVFLLENIRTKKLGRPLGDGTGGSPQPDKMESRFSGRSLEDVRDNLRGFELFYFGDEDRDGSLGLGDFAPEFDGEVRAQLEVARATLDGVSAPLARAITEEPEQVRSLMEALRELQRLMQVDVLPALGLTPRFNDSDGD